MRIQRLDITGFKSFMSRSVFAFDDGITGVVGPNGCGKSNVVDSIRWVMGEQSAKSLRGRGMEDVIFNGSESHPALSMAEVSLTFKVEETDTLAPQYAGFSEITVTRRLFRSGESEYLINKTACRLLDITELFLGTGVGRGAYSIIEQGRVGQIVSARPEDRRAFIEEAAGVTKYKARRKAAERKMEYTQQNLLRVNDIVSELEKRLESLDRQARKAEKYKKLKTEMREIELHSASHRYLELTAELKVLSHRLESLSAEEQQSLDASRALETAIAQKRLQQDQETRALEELGDQSHALESQRQLDAQNLAHWTTDADATRRRVEQAAAEGEALGRREEELSLALFQGRAELESLGGASREHEVAAQVAQEELRRATTLQLELAALVDQERSALVDLVGRLANHETNLTNLLRRRAELSADRSKNRGEADSLRAQEAELDRARTEVQERVGHTRQLAQELAERRGHEEETLARTRDAFAESEVEVIRAREELGDKRSRLASLEEIQRNYEGFDRGVRAVMLKAGADARQHGVFGVVADVVSTTPTYEKAVEAALGERLQHVIVENKDRGYELVEYLRSVSEGRSSFVPVQSVHPIQPLAAPDLTRPGVLAAAHTVVQCEELLRPVVDALLGDVVIVADLETARAYEVEGGSFTLVTVAGEVLRSDGTLTGGVHEGPAVGALQKKREIAELGQEVVRLETRYNELITRHYGLQKQMGLTEGALKGLAKNQHAEELNLATQEKDLHKAAEDLARLRDRLTALDREHATLEEALASLGVEEESTRAEVAHGTHDRAAREDRLRQMGSEVDSLRGRVEALTAELTTLRVKAAADTERGEALRKELEQLAAQEADLRERRARLAESQAEGTARLDELAARIEATARERAEREQRHQQLLAELDALRKAHAEGVATIRDDEGRLRELRARLDELTHGLSEVSIRERELLMQMDLLSQQMAERHQVELKHELHRYHLLAPLEAEAEKRLKELRGQVERMGEINLTAIEEHAQLRGRFDFLSGQKKDLEGSLEQLEEAIVKIDKTSRERFKQTFEIVNEKFQQIFPRLFGGGRAGLVLTEEGGGGEPGVEILAQPPGKKLQSVNLMSGGEKALTAVSLIFAIFLIKPTPFCLLDEVDAPLDEANVGRYNDMVREMSQQSQFIVITHNKRTMECADTLYGVTMEEPGVSKLVSVRMREAVGAANENVA